MVDTRSSRRGALCAVFVLIGLLVDPLSPRARAAAPEAAPFDKAQALVGVEAGQRSVAADAISAHGGRILSFYEPGRFFIVRPNIDVASWVASIRNARGIRYAEPDFVLSNEDVTPDDPSYGSQWSLPIIGAPTAWQTTTGSADVVVGVVDSGVDYTHPDLASQMWTNPGEIPGNGIDDDLDGYVDDVHGADCRDNDGDPMDDNGHGTHVAGTIGATGNNGVGITGVAWNVSLMALRFLGSSGTGLVSDAIECIDFGIAHGVDLTNNSYGDSVYSQALFDAIARTRTAGQLFVASAGNLAADTDSGRLNYPSSYDLDNVVAVAASNQSDGLWFASNRGPMTVDLAAPGENILSTVPGGGYELKSGTSMAAPHVAGAAALVLTEFPSATYRQLEDRLLGSVDRSAAFAATVGSGGRLNVARAIEDDVTPPTSPTLFVNGRTATSIEVAWTAPGDDAASGGPASSYELLYAPAGSSAWAQAPAPTPMSPGSTQSGAILGLRPGRSYDISLTASDNVGNTATSTTTAATTAGVEIFYDDLEHGSTGWSIDAPWSIAAEHPASPTHSWADSPGLPYANALDRSIRSPSFSLAGAVDPKLSFWQRFNLQKAADFGSVLVSTDGGTSWTQLAQFTGAQSLSPAVLDLAAFAGAPDVKIRFRLTSDASFGFDGWYVDDVLVTARDVPPAAPQGLTATPGDARVDLDWNDNTDTDLAGYTVYRTLDPPGAGSRSWASVGSPTTSVFTDQGLTNATTYYYRVTALDIAGNESDPSAEASAMPRRTSSSFSPVQISIAKGRSLGDPLANVATSDDKYFRIDSTAAGKNHFVDWFGSFTVDVGPIRAITITYEGSWSVVNEQQDLYVRNWVSGAWDPVSTTTTSSSDATVTWSTINPNLYRSNNGEIRVRILSKARTPMTCRADLMQVTLDY
jgi:subtilisin family serine protease